MPKLSRRRTAAFAATLLALAWWPSEALAQTNRERYSIEARLVDRAPRIDGVLDEQAWQTAGVVDKFTQQEPHIGEPSTERTEVRVLYDGRHLYIGVHAFDTNPSAIVASEMRRDSNRLLDEDSFQVIIDSFNDSRSGYMFVTSPLGAKLEQQISEEGEGNTRGTNSNVNRNWDGIWDSVARITDDGWTAEISIPTTTLRFKSSEAQTWGINFMRNIRHKNEVAFWAPIPKAYSLTRVSLAGTLTGLRSLSQGMDLKLKPFIVNGVRDKHLTSASRTTSWLRDVGLDAKYGVTSGLNLDVTVNTDFAQAEVDEQQVNLTRFGLLFPEKRDFFLENAGMFNMGTGNTFSSTQVATDLFFTRRIGLSSTGQPVPILGGARLTGKIGPDNIALLNIQTESAFGKPGDNFLVARYSRDVLQRSRLGAILVNKESTGGSGHFNRTVGADANFAIGRGLQASSFIARTSTPGLNGKDMALFGRVAYRTPDWNLWLNYLDIEDNFNAEVGFVQRKGVRATKAYFSPTPRPGKAHIRLMEPMLVVAYITDQANRMVGRTIHTMLGTTLDDGSFINVIYQKNLDVLDKPFPIRTDVTIPVGTYRFDELSLTYNTSPARKLYQRFTYSPQQFYGGTEHSVNTSLGFRASSQLASELQYQRDAVNLPYGNFVANLAILRVDYALSPRMTIRSLTQYNSSTHEVTNSVRYNFIYRPGSDLYVVYNDLQQTGVQHGVFAYNDRQFVIKLNYLLAR
ncbi:MAG: hypothetical protein EXQ48_04190 [Acidobacteria bacterium]|nr:hypothetical protein [Acidobacteriota bacterium]